LPKSPIKPLFLLLLSIYLLSGTFAYAQDSYAYCAYDINAKSWIAQRNFELPIKPASVQKIFVAAAALKNLGPEFRFETSLAVDRIDKHIAQTLYLIGGGDPSLSTEDLWVLSRSAKLAGISKVKRIVVDDSFHHSQLPTKGARAYETGTSALAINYNSVAVTGCFGGAGEGVAGVDPWESGLSAEGRIKASSSAVPSLSVSSEAVRGAYSVQGGVSPDSGCIRVYRSNDTPSIVAGKVFLEGLKYLGIETPNSVERGEAPVNAPIIDVRLSAPLREIVWGMNNFSTNMIADQLLISLGIKGRGALDIESGAAELRRILGLSRDARFIDGSGLSHDNRLKVSEICNLLIESQDDWTIAPDFISSLAVSGRSGTLRRRSFGLPDGVVRGKTGTIAGVSSLAGYILTSSGKKIAFAVVFNGEGSKDEALRFEDKFVASLYRGETPGR